MFHLDGWSYQSAMIATRYIRCIHACGLRSIKTAAYSNL